MLLIAWSLVSAASGTLPSGDAILTKVAEENTKRQSLAYSGARRYKLQNNRFHKSAMVSVKVTHHPKEGKRFTVVEYSGSERMIGIVEKLLAFEADASKPESRGNHEIGPANYEARVRGIETKGTQTCYVLELTPKHRSKYLISGTVWVDRDTYSIVRLEGTTGASISMWLGAPHVAVDFEDVLGIWLPTHTVSVSSSFLLGTSALDISYTDYRIEGQFSGSEPGAVASSPAVTAPARDKR